MSVALKARTANQAKRVELLGGRNLLAKDASPRESRIRFFFSIAISLGG
jgi:hypothetical protein